MEFIVKYISGTEKAPLSLFFSNTVPTALCGKKESLLNMCCKSIFFLPPESDVPETGVLYAETMDALDTMLEGFVRNCPIASFNIEMQNMLKVMLDFAVSKNSAVRESAVKVIERLITFIRWYLVIKGFGGYLFPDERLDIILTALEALQDSSIHDKKRACSVLDAALEVPDYWLTDVPTIVECIRRNLGSIHTASARQCLDSLLLQLTKKMPWREVMNLLQFSPPRDSTDLAMWEVILAMPKTLNWVLNFMMGFLQLCYWCTAVSEDTCIRRLAMLAQNESYEFGNPVHLQSYLRHPSPEMRFLVLKGLCTVSESPEKAREIQVLLPDILEALQDTNTDVVLKALLVLKNVMAHVERRKASGLALQLAEKLLPFFDHASSQVQEHSICLFQTVVEAVLRQRKKEMKRTVHRSLLPLYFHMRDQSESVAKCPPVMPMGLQNPPSAPQ
ncbi:uncharacterized protein [Anas platyrhynchos]|uniref:uncharacterized protein n=1 Tax=Anas platyrhynchos TaxID=8839 RepID=UPI003AF201F1